MEPVSTFNAVSAFSKSIHSLEPDAGTRNEISRAGIQCRRRGHSFLFSPVTSCSRAVEPAIMAIPAIVSIVLTR
jgi:hypothetical protein